MLYWRVSQITYLHDFWAGVGGECATQRGAGLKRGSNPWPSCCEATVLTSAQTTSKTNVVERLSPNTTGSLIFGKVSLGKTLKSWWSNRHRVWQLLSSVPECEATVKRFGKVVMCLNDVFLQHIQPLFVFTVINITPTPHPSQPCRTCWWWPCPTAEATTSPQTWKATTRWATVAISKP